MIIPYAPIARVVLAFLLMICGSALAQDKVNPPSAAVAAQDDATLAKRVELATKMHEIRPTRDQVNQAIEQIAMTQPEKEREAFKAAMREILNYRAIEKISIDAMADTFTEPELQAMVDYYSKPEARSASDKDGLYRSKVYPEIIRMLDAAMMRVKTGGN